MEKYVGDAIFILFDVFLIFFFILISVPAIFIFGMITGLSLFARLKILDKITKGK